MPPVEVPGRLVDAAVAGDRQALEELLRLVAGDVRRLAQRMLWHPQDAEDATQEILVKVATRLSSFRGSARVTTWVHRIAVNHLLTTRRRRAEDPSLTFAAFGRDDNPVPGRRILTQLGRRHASNSLHYCRGTENPRSGMLRGF